MPSFDVLTFDCYGTLVDWDAGIGAAFVETAAAQGVELDREAVRAAYARAERAVQAGPFRAYRDVLAATAFEVARQLGWNLDATDAGFLARSLPSWPVFVDTNPALERLVSLGASLGILSNVDDDLLAGTRRHLSVDFDLVVTAQQVRSYKPARGHFDRARSLVGDRRWLHVAQSYFHDIEPAVALGIPVVWVNRKGEKPSGTARPTAEVRDLTELVQWLDRYH
jgi:2-haloacid dehalogenase